MAIRVRTNGGWRVAISGARLEDALHRCILLASPHGTIELLKPVHPGTREFVLDLTESGSQRLRWTLTTVDSGTMLWVRSASVAWLPAFAQRAMKKDHGLERKLKMLPEALNLKIVVLGSGTGLYTTLRGLRDRTWSLTAVVRGSWQRRGPSLPKDELGFLPADDASLCLVALAPDADDTMVLRSLLEHRMRDGDWRGTHLGSVLLQALGEIQGSSQAALDAAGRLLGLRGRIVQAGESPASPDGPPEAMEAAAAIMEANLAVIAPGRAQTDILPLLSMPSIAGAIRETAAIKVVVTKIMTAEADSSDQPTTSHQLGAIMATVPFDVDFVLANSARFTAAQLAAYGAVGARPVIPDLEATSQFARQVITERLVAPGHLARHDPDELGDALVAIGTDSFLFSSTQQARALAG